MASRPAVPQSGPWTRHDQVLMIAGVVLGAALLLVAWMGTSGEVTLGDQLGWVSVGALAFVPVAAVNARWIVRGRRSVLRQRHRAGAGPGSTLGRQAGQGADPAVATERFVAGDRMTRYHRTHCQLVQGKPVSGYSRSEQEQAGREACGVCRP